MQLYTLIFLTPRHIPDRMLVVLKNRPASQKGKYNLPGGKVEPNEGLNEAASRELMEETGFYLPPEELGESGIICGSWGMVYCFKGTISEKTYKEQPIKPADGETEVVSWEDWHKLKNNKNIMPNMKLAVPLMQAGMEGWVIADEGHSTPGLPHQISVTV